MLVFVSGLDQNQRPFQLALHWDDEAVAALGKVDSAGPPVLAFDESPSQGGNVHARIDIPDH